MTATTPARWWGGIERLGQTVIRLLAGLFEDLDFLAVVLMSAGSMPLFRAAPPGWYSGAGAGVLPECWRYRRRGDDIEHLSADVADGILSNLPGGPQS